MSRNIVVAADFDPIVTQERVGLPLKTRRRFHIHRHVGDRDAIRGALAVFVPLPNAGGRLTDARLARSSPDIEEAKEDNFAFKIAQAHDGVRWRKNLAVVIGPAKAVGETEIIGHNIAGPVGGSRTHWENVCEDGEEEQCTNTERPE